MITKQKIEEIKETIVKAVFPSKIILFGSYASGNYNKDSDIDLIVIQESFKNHHQRNMEVRRLFPQRDFSIDVFVYTPEEENKYKSIKGTILNTAFRDGIILYERN